MKFCHFKIILLVPVCLLFSLVNAQSTLYKDPKQPIEIRVQDLLKRMTPEEKFWQCFMIPGDLDNVPKNQYHHGIFGFTGQCRKSRMVLQSGRC